MTADEMPSEHAGGGLALAPTEAERWWATNPEEVAHRKRVQQEVESLRIREEARRIVAEVEHPAAGRLRQARPAARFSATPAELRRPAPGLGEHTAEVLAEAGYTAAEVEALRAAGAFGAAQEDTP